MNARVFTMVLVSAVFMSIWNADHRAMELSLAKRQQPSPLSADVQSVASLPYPVTHLPTAVEDQHAGAPAEELLTHDGLVAIGSGASDTIPISLTTALMIISLTQSPDLAQHWSEPVVTAAAGEVSSIPQPGTSGEMPPMPVEVGGRQYEFSPQQLIAALSDFAVVMMEHRDQGQVAGSVDVNLHEPIAAEVAIAEQDVKIVTEPSTLTAHADVEARLTPVAITETEEVHHQISQAATSETEQNPSIIPLPRNLASGTWQVMTQSGEYFRITIDRSSFRGMQTEPQAESMEEQISVVTTDDGVRWCFIRFNPETPDAARRVATEFFAPVQR